jgi:hypothetical protein
MNKKLETLVLKKELHHSCFSVNALLFIPMLEEKKPSHMSIFSHGYTSSKNDLISWATRLSEAQIPTIIFDLPGHYLGSFSPLSSFSDFKDHAHELFSLAKTSLSQELTTLKKHVPAECVVGGHSLGSLLAVKAAESSLSSVVVAVGMGLNQQTKTHLFDSPLYQKTLNIRRQLISEHLDPDHVFPWVRESKIDLKIKNKTVIVITGKDDAVVGPGGAIALTQILEPFNKVILVEPDRLAHHQPELASTHIYHALKPLVQWT